MRYVFKLRKRYGMCNTLKRYVFDSVYKVRKRYRTCDILKRYVFDYVYKVRKIYEMYNNNNNNNNNNILKKRVFNNIHMNVQMLDFSLTV